MLKNNLLTEFNNLNNVYYDCITNNTKKCFLKNITTKQDSLGEESQYFNKINQDSIKNFNNTPDKFNLQFFNTFEKDEKALIASYRREKRKKIHMSKRKGRVDLRTNRPGKRK